jgi:hypothetical protein
LTAKNDPETTLFGRKTGGPRQQNDTCFRAFSLLRGFFFRKPLPDRNLRGAEPSQKNHAKKPTVGFPFFGACARIHL